MQPRRWPLAAKVPLMVAALVLLVAVLMSAGMLVLLAHEQQKRVAALAGAYLEGATAALAPALARHDIWDAFDTLDRFRRNFAALDLRFAVAVLPDGTLLRDGQVTPDGYAVNTIQSANMPHRLSITDPSRLLPPQHAVTIGDRLSEKGVSWAWYSAGWNDAVAGRPDRLFQFHHQPFAYFAQFGDETPGRAAHLKDEADFLRAIDDGTLPAVTFYKPLGEDNEHPGYAALLRGDQHTADLVRRIQASPVWKDSIIVVTYDENGGTWDHVAPPRLDRWGPGTRVPTLLISPFAKHGFVDHTPYDTSSILKLIETRFHLAPLSSRDAVAYDLTNGLSEF